MIALDYEITTFICLSGGHVTVMERLVILWDSAELRCKVVSGCFGGPFEYNVGSVPTNKLVRDFISWDYIGGDGFC